MKRSVHQEVPKPEPVTGPVAAGIASKILAGGGKDPRFYLMGDCSVIVALEPMGFRTSLIEVSHAIIQLRWHLSIAHPDRYPTWDEIVAARDALLPSDKAFAQILPADWDEWVNIDNNCFHLWEIHDRSG